jgi:hypothetical protein
MIAKHLVELHKGKSASKASWAGTTFHFTPRGHAGASQDREPPVPGAGGFEAPRRAISTIS